MGTALMPEARERREMFEEIIDDARNNVAIECQRIGGALHGIRTEKLYADDYETFDGYVQAVWDFDPVCAGHWITASQVADGLQEFGLAIDQLTKSAAIALSHTDNPVQVWSEVSAASPSPTALEIEQVASLHKPLLSGAESMTKDEERQEIASAEDDIENAVILAECMKWISLVVRKNAKLLACCDPRCRKNPKVETTRKTLEDLLAGLMVGNAHSTPRAPI